MRDWPYVRLMIVSAEPSPLLFEAVATPPRSMGRAGLRWLVGFIVVLSTGISAGLWWAGAWPVVGFNGAEVALAVLLLRRHERRSRATERITLTEDVLRIVRRDGAGRETSRCLQPYWLQVSLSERAGHAPRLWLSERGDRVEIGACLSEPDKRGLAASLTEAIRLQRCRTYDTP